MNRQPIYVGVNKTRYEVINPKDVCFANAKRFKEVASIKARPARPGEIVITFAEGIFETKNQAKAGEFVVTNPAGEKYILSE